MPTWLGDLTLLAHRARRGRGQRAEHLLRRDVVPGPRHQAAATAAPCHRRGRLRRRSASSSPGRARRPRRELRELPAGHRLLDRPLARRRARRPVAAPRRRRRLADVSATRSTNWAGPIAMWSRPASSRSGCSPTRPSTSARSPTAHPASATSRSSSASCWPPCSTPCCARPAAAAHRPAVDGAGACPGMTPTTRQHARGRRRRGPGRAGRGRHPDRRRAVRRRRDAARPRPQPAGPGRRPVRCTARPSAFRNAGRQRTYRGTTMVTTLSPCWYCSGLVRQFGISPGRGRRGPHVLRRPRLAGRERRRGGRARRPGVRRA